MKDHLFFQINSFRPTRRHVLAAGLGLTISGGIRGASRVLADEPTLIVRNTLPLDAETPVSELVDDLTSNDRFFVRSHFGAPAANRRPWEVTLGGRVKRPMNLNTETLLKRFKPAGRRAVLQCSGNGRAFFDPVIPGVAWERGAVGNALWEGVRLGDVLREAGLESNAAHVHFRGADGPHLPRTPAWVRSIPLDRALDEDVLLATRMNGEPMPRLHGGPLRLVVPGWTGNHWMKWVRSIEVSTEEAPGFFQQSGYRLPRTPKAPGEAIKPEELEPVTWMNVKSLIVQPAAGATVAPGPVEARGVAWTGQGRVTRVEVEIDGQWRDAELVGPDEEGSWRSWRVRWNAAAGTHVLRARATDSQGETQPEVPPWNRSGYLWNGFDRVEFLAR